MGYALGAGRSSHVVLTAREDHNSGSPNYSPGGLKVHFDLAGYDILFWAQDNLEGFRDELVKRVTRRQQLPV